MQLPTTHSEHAHPPEILEAISMPLTGQALIEASAGTGKTYTLAALYLRLLLGLGRTEPLEVDRILVVTFTEAATQELRERIRTRIQEARIAFVLGASEDVFIQQLLAQHEDHERAVLDLEFAASEMDQAAIFTIHGFCQRMLKQHAFESGANFGAELISDDSDIVRQALLDYWRVELYHAPSDLAQEILACYASPDALLSKIRGYLGLSNLQLEPDFSAFDLPQKWQEFLSAQQQLRIALLAVQSSDDPNDDLQALIQNSSVDKRSYSKKHLPNWYAKIMAFAAGEKAPFKELAKFSQQQLIEKCKTDVVPEHLMFEKIAGFCELQINFKAVIFCRALNVVRDNMQREKNKLQLQSFDDLLQKLAAALDDVDLNDSSNNSIDSSSNNSASSSSNSLALAIRKQYPFALIDEFQDTDPEQYKIFSQLYQVDNEGSEASDSSSSGLGLLMIGDPKQSIYAFRGADIFTYMTARRQVKKHYTLGTNWRSSNAMVGATNQLFSRSPAAFIYRDDIPFHPVEAAKKGASQLMFAGKKMAALNFWLSNEKVNNDQYLQNLAVVCATQIERMMKEGTLKDKAITAKNIAILVRDRKEAGLVQQALLKVKIDSVFMSNRDNVYSMNIARELEYVLKAVNEPNNERYLRSALATEIFQLNAAELYDLNQDEIAWEALVEDFLILRKIWSKSGVLAMLHALLQQRELAKRWLSYTDGERRLTDFLHLSELLQQASAQLESKEALIRYLQDRRLQPANQAQEQQLRLDSDRARVTVITIHKSKGLEYDLVYIPFACRYRSNTNKLYHDEQGQAILATTGEGETDRQDKEALAEDLRLLYVAITRAAHGCFIGMADVCLRNKSVWHKTAIGYLLTLITEQGESKLLQDITLQQALAELSANSAEIKVLDTANISISQPDLFGAPMLVDESKENDLSNAALEDKLQVTNFTRVIEYDWRVTSYSALSRNAQHSTALESNKLDIEVADEMDVPELTLELVEDSIFTFAKGAVAGTFLHSIYEDIDFAAQDISQIEEVLAQRLPATGYDLAWLPCLASFVYQSLEVVLEAKESQQQFCLQQITTANRLVEMEFVLVFKAIECQSVNRLLAKYDPLAKRAGQLVFSRIAGMLKGFIDLTLRFEGKYYVVDYKSNYLGDTLSDYQIPQLELAMIDHRYDFQYVLYTLALHRFLRNRIVDYDYDKDIGGVFYLFLRGLSPDSDTGIYYTKPARILIEKLDKLFEEGA